MVRKLTWIVLVNVVVMSNTLSLRTENQVLNERKGRERLTKAVDSVRLMDISDFGENEKVKFYTELGVTSIPKVAMDNGKRPFVGGFFQWTLSLWHF